MDQEELLKLLADVKASILPQLEGHLAKSEDESPDNNSSGSSGPTESDGKTAEADSQKAPEKAEASTDGAGDSPELKGDGPPGGGEPDGAPEGLEAGPEADPSLAADAVQAPPSMEELQALFMELPDEELKMYFMAIKGALMARAQAALPAQGGLPGASPMGQPPAPAAPMGAAPPVPPAPAPAPPMNPTAASPAPAIAPAAPTLSPPDQGLALKSLQGEFDTLKKAFEETLGMVKELGVGMRKSVEFGYQVDKSKDPTAMSQDEINKKLTEKMASGKLHKSEQDLILAYNLKLVNLDQVKHLLS